MHAAGRPGLIFLGRFFNFIIHFYGNDVRLSFLLILYVEISLSINMVSGDYFRSHDDLAMLF